MSENECTCPTAWITSGGGCQCAPRATVTAPRADVDELGRLLTAATPGPWEAQGGMVVSDPGPCAKYVADCYDEPKVSAADAALIAALVNAAPALLAEVSELRATVARVEAELDSMMRGNNSTAAAHPRGCLRLNCTDCARSHFVARVTAALGGAS